MTTVVFAILAASWGLLSFYFCWRFILKQKPQSIVIALACLSPVVHVARELHLLSRMPTTFFLAAGCSIGVLGVLIVAHYESQQARPWR